MFWQTFVFLVFKFWLKLRLDVNISLFVNRLISAKSSAGAPSLFAGQSTCNVCCRQNYDFSYFSFTTIFLSNGIIAAISRKIVRMSSIDYIYLGLAVRSSRSANPTISNFAQTLATSTLNISLALLKPQQCLFILNNNLIPSLYHQL